MSDLLVKLYKLPPPPPAPDGVRIRRVLVPERSVVVDWVESNFTRGWADEVRVATAGHPVSCFVATMASDSGEMLAGFACYNATFKGYFGPVGVGAAHRGRGIGSALTLAALHALKEDGFAYGVIGWVKDAAYFERLAGASVIPDSSPGAYRGMLR